MPQLAEREAQPIRPLMNIRDVRPLSEEDNACMAELAAVLKRHGSLDRFGLTLLHEHFSTGPDEVMLETNDPIARTLLIKPVPKTELYGVDSVVTSWRLDDIGRPLMACSCIKDGADHSHQSRG